MKNFRIFVEKKDRFRVEAESLKRELNSNLNLQIEELRLLCVYAPMSIRFPPLL